MKHVLVTGSAGFVGKNLVAALRRREDVSLSTFDIEDDKNELKKGLLNADVIYHLAGVNRPKTNDEFSKGNAGLTEEIAAFLEKNNRQPVIILASSIQADLENPYGQSKKAAEDALFSYHGLTGAPICIYRFPNLFGKWSQPNYNTVVATFCHNIARGLEITISDPNHEVEFVYIDDVVQAFLAHLDSKPNQDRHWYTISRVFRVTLGDLAARIRTLHEIRKTLVVPDLSDDFMKCLHATYLSFLPEDDFAYPVKLNTDDRGWLFELIKSEQFGQIFVSKTMPGITRGDHFHDTKLEKFCVIQGEGVIRFRQIESEEILEYPVDGNDIKIADIPPGYTHSIENTGEEEMICLFWANQIFNPESPDTYFVPVKTT
ncbi:capsular polysaccharide biosynthesis protein Cap8F [Desulfoluna limicola]|uniref:Capsular polysaccharide biosynthesis protein Cap8F n=1 Tax=Desulfoluna limicola TaxID=2810562 RepID=A0ABN6F1Y3_9BACT|nr:NAD-dependent epimerase/dehydratase family protein [Desulfoluna limicola]BCS95596.1 capsular polysaccharide biosynthesis protein Cap8F [Desulfoluna limicola]